MSARNSRFGAFGLRSGRGNAAGAVIACAVMLLAGCGGSGGSATEASAGAGSPIVRGDAAPSVAQATLTVSNTLLTGTVGTNIALTTSGGSGTGDVTFTVTGTECSLNVGTSLKATDATTCIVTATKAASTGFLEATSATTTFTFTVAPVALTVSNTTLTGTAGTAITLATSGGSGTGDVTFTVTSTDCSVTETRKLNAAIAATCIVTATKAASTGYLEATSATKTFTFAAAPVAQDTLTLSNTPLTGTAGTKIALTTSGGSGDGAVTFTLAGEACSIVVGTSLQFSLKAAYPTTCIVTARKAASTGWLAATSATTTFTFAAVPVAQDTLTLSNKVLTYTAGNIVSLTTAGGSGTGAVTYTVTGTGCSVSATSLDATPPATCVVTATKAASTGWLAATSATATFTSIAYQAVLRVEGDTLTAKVGNAIALTTSGGSGTGAVTFKVVGGACLFDGKKRLIATGVTVCIVTAKKAASTGYLATESESKTFSYTKK